MLDGADGIVLGSETFRGKFPVASVETVLAICRQVRAHILMPQLKPKGMQAATSDAGAWCW